MPPENHHTPITRLEPGKSPPAHYYAENLLAIIGGVLHRYGDLLRPDERCFGERIVALPASAQRLLARLIGRRGPFIREDSLAYAEVGDLQSASAALAAAELIERNPPAPAVALCDLLTMRDLDSVFAQELNAVRRRPTKPEQVSRILAGVPESFLRWRVRRAVPWLRVRDLDHLDLYRLLFFGDREQDLTTFVMRDLGVHKYEPIELSRATRLFADRKALDQYLALVAMQDEVAALGACPDMGSSTDQVANLLERLRDELDHRALERRRSRLLNHLGRSLERAEAYDWALRCYARSTLAPARERQMRILHRLGDLRGVERLRRAVLADPETMLEADFANRFARPYRREPVPTTDVELDSVPLLAIEQYALGLLTASGGTGWHLENNLPMAVFGLAYWPWVFAPIEGAFLHPFQTGPQDLFWPDFFTSRQADCPDPLRGRLKRRLRAVACAKAGTVNRLFSWQRCPPTVFETVLDAIPEPDLRALVEIVRDDLAGKRSGFPDLTIIYEPGRYEFVEVKGPNDQLQIHQRLWIHALLARGLPVRVLRFQLRREPGDA